jgi:GLPGLI family protein
MLLSKVILAQTIEVKYDFTLIDEKDDFGDIRVENLILTTNATESSLRRKSKDTIFECNLYGIFESSSTKGKGKFYELTEYKNLSLSEYYFTGPYMKDIVKDDIYKINWDLINEEKLILGYQCQKAICTFRGRSYEAFFAKTIPISNGPFKFDGLPGMILAINSVDGTVHIKAKSVTILNEAEIVNPYKNTNNITWIDFKKKYKTYYNSVINYKSSLESEIFIPNRGIEFYLE